MNPTARYSVRIAGAWMVLLAAACVDAPPRGSEAGQRDNDDLLERPALQAVVDRQVARDAAALVELLEAEEPTVRARAAFALGSVQDLASAPPLVEALEDPSAQVRRDAAFALGRVGGGSVTADALIAALEQERNRDVQRQLIESLGMVGEADAVERLAAYRNPRFDEVILLALSRAVLRGVAPPAALERLAAGLRHADADVRQSAAYAVGRADDPSVWSPIADRVAPALATYGPDDDAARLLLQGMGKNPEIFDAAVIADWLASSTDWRTRVNAAEALGVRPPGAVAFDALMRALDDPSGHVREQAATSLAAHDLDEERLGRVVAWIGSDPDDWRAMAPLLVAVGRAGRSDVALDVLRESYVGDQERAVVGAEVLGDLQDEGALDLLRQVAVTGRPEAASAAAGSVVRMWRRARSAGDDATPYYETLVAVLGADDPRVVRRAAETLFERGFEDFDASSALARAYEERSEAGIPVRDALLRGMGRARPGAVEALLRRELDDSAGPVRVAAAFALSQVTGVPVSAPRMEGEEAEGGPEGGRGGAALPPYLGSSIDWAALGALGRHPRLHLETERGTVVVRLDAEEAPMTVQTVAAIAEAGLYDGAPFHRVLPNFVVQGGDVGRGSGLGGPGFRIRTELTSRPFVRGAIGMASSGKDTEGSQFFIMHSSQPHLDGSYTAFGVVVEGMDVVDAIRRGDRIVRARVTPGER